MTKGQKRCKHYRVEHERLDGLMLWRCFRCHAEIYLTEREIAAYAHGEVAGARSVKRELRLWMGLRE
jgi:hypothetical protein